MPNIRLIRVAVKPAFRDEHRHTQSNRRGVRTFAEAAPAITWAASATFKLNDREDEIHSQPYSRKWYLLQYWSSSKWRWRIEGPGTSIQRRPAWGQYIATARTPLLLIYNFSDYLVVKCNGEGGKTNCDTYHIDYQCQKWKIYRGGGELVYLVSGTP